MGSQNKSDYGREFLRLLDLNRWCKYVGSGGANEVRKVLSEVDVLIHPSIEDNCPMAILEGMAAGLPVAASNIGGIPDLVEPGKTGLLFDPHDANSITHALETLLRDPSLTEKMGAAGRERARTEFSTQVVAKRHLEIYQEVLGRSQ
jgi:glycosyltransferase involved in cell wall biosynthesis